MGKGCTFIQIDDKVSACCCGGSDHECNINGVTIYTFEDGDMCSAFDKAVAEGVNPQMCTKDILYFLEQNGFSIQGESCSCSICGRPAFLDHMF